MDKVLRNKYFIGNMFLNNINTSTYLENMPKDQVESNGGVVLRINAENSDFPSAA